MAEPRRPLISVLGASGFIGSAVTALLADHPVRLRTVARRRTGALPGARAEMEAMALDLTDAANVARAVEGADVVIHLVAKIGGAATWRVAEHDTLGEQTNLGSLRGVIAAVSGRADAHRRPTVVFASSASQTCAPTTVRLDGSQADEPSTTYGRQKVAAEHALKAATRDGTLRGIILRLPTVFGQQPASRAADRGVVATMVRRALAGEPLMMWNDGSVERDLLYIDDAARAFLAALDHPNELAGAHWLVGTGRRTKLADLFATITELVAETTGRPAVRLVSVEPPREATVTDFHSYAIDASAFRTVTGWRPRVGLSDALATTVATMASADGSAASA